MSCASFPAVRAANSNVTCSRNNNNASTAGMIFIIYHAAGENEMRDIEI